MIMILVVLILIPDLLFWMKFFNKNNKMITLLLFLLAMVMEHLHKKWFKIWLIKIKLTILIKKLTLFLLVYFIFYSYFTKYIYLFFILNKCNIYKKGVGSGFPTFIALNLRDLYHNGEKAIQPVFLIEKVHFCFYIKTQKFSKKK